LRQSAEIGTAIIRVINAGKIHLAFEKVGSLKQSDCNQSQIINNF
jgi:hypothetical protein